MSSVYVGPYLYCENPQIERIEKIPCCDITSCRYHKWEDHSQNKFCASCGTIMTGVVEKKRIDDKIVITDDFLFSFKELIFKVQIAKIPISYDYWMPGYNHEFKKRVDIGKTYHNAAFAYQMNIQTSIDEIARFKSVFGDFIQRIQELYGNGEVRWGTICYP